MEEHQKLLQEQKRENEELQRTINRLQEEKAAASEVFSETIAKYEGNIEVWETASHIHTSNECHCGLSICVSLMAFCIQSCECRLVKVSCWGLSCELFM